MDDKFPVLVAYGVVGLAMALVMPVLGRGPQFAASIGLGEGVEEPRWTAVLVSVLLVMLLWYAHGLLPWRFVIGCLLASVLIGRSGEGSAVVAVPAILLGLIVSAVLPWWARDASGLTLGVAQSWRVPLVTALAYWMLTRRVGEDGVTPSSRNARRVACVATGLAIIGWTLLTGTSLTTAGGTNWHHWGAYIGPAQLVNAGAFPLHDFPLQYGLGPTLLVAVGCRADCWTSFYWFAGLSSIAMTTLLCSLALQFHDSRHPLSALATVAIMAACCMLWTAFPPSLLSPLATPSTSGMRFLPGVLVLFVLVRHELRARSGSSGAFPRVAGHLIWLASMLWSPEAALHASALWCPYFAWSRSRGNLGAFALARVMRAALELACVGAAGVGLFALTYYGLLGAWPLATVYLAYLMHPPGPLPINPRGPVVFAMTAFGCWVVAYFLGRRSVGARAAAGPAWLAAMLCYATFTYYLGRSHDNNILNLLPFVALVLIATRSRSARGAMRTLSTAMLASLAGWTLLFGGENIREAQARGDLFTFDPGSLVRTFRRDSELGLPYLQPLARALNLKPQDAIAALKFIRANYREPVEIYDLYLLVDSGEPYPPWDALHGPENFAFFPDVDRRVYLARVAARLGRPGWVLYSKTTDMSAYLDEYGGVYVRTRELDFGTYKAVRFVPRPH